MRRRFCRLLFGLVFLIIPGCGAATPAQADPKLGASGSTAQGPRSSIGRGESPRTTTPAKTPSSGSNAATATTTATRPSAQSSESAENESENESEPHDPDDEEGPDDDLGESGEAAQDEEHAEHPESAPKAPATTAKTPPKKTSPLLTLSAAELAARYRRDPASVGTLSLGAPNAGALVNGVQMPKSEHWIMQSPALCWGTQETVDGISRSIEKVAAAYPGSPPLAIGHISSRKGGYLSPHKSHQSGRDVDLGYYHSPPKKFFVRATAKNLDFERTLALVKAIVDETEVDLVLIDTSVQRLLVKYALKAGEDEAWLDRVFQVRNKHPRPIVRHARGHGNHLHVRFVSPVAQELGRRAGSFLKREKVAPPHVAQSVVMHKAKSGDTLMILARRYGTTVEAIQGANGLKTVDIKMGRTYRIPVPKRVSRARSRSKGVTLPKRPGKTPRAGAKSQGGKRSR